MKMNDTYVIINSTTGQVIDIVWNMCCTIGMIDKLEKLNPNVKLNYRVATLKEQSNAHNIQLQARSSNIVFPQ